MHSVFGGILRKFYGNRIALALVACIVVLSIGTGGYMSIEGFSLVDGLYMSAITISTVGFGEVNPLSPLGRAFTTGYIVLSFLALAFTGHAIGQSLLVGIWSGRTDKKKMRKQINSLTEHYIICGYGRVGAAAAMNFHDLGYDFVVIEANENQTKHLQEQGIPYLVGDATHEQILIEAGIERAVGILAMLDSDPDNLFVVLTSRELNPTLKIFARSSDTSSGNRILKAGADEVISPLMTAGQQIANDMLLATGRVTSEMDTGGTCMQTVRWLAATEGNGASGLTLTDWGKACFCNIVGLRRNGKDIIMPPGDLLVEKDDRLLVVQNGAKLPGEHPPVTQALRKIVIVDDNPVIVGLYSRLFHKAGFIPLIAKNGAAGLDLVMHENPAAAVVDYHLPEMSGADVCRKIRRTPEYDAVKLILFTADDRPKIREEARKAGIDAVVVKSPNANEVIEAVLSAL